MKQNARNIAPEGQPTVAQNSDAGTAILPDLILGVDLERGRESRTSPESAFTPALKRWVTLNRPSGPLTWNGAPIR